MNGFVAKQRRIGGYAARISSKRNGRTNAYESSPFQPWNGPLALLKNTATKSLQSQTGPVFAWGYWSAIYVRQVDAWKIRMLNLIRAPGPACRDEVDAFKTRMRPFHGRFRAKRNRSSPITCRRRSQPPNFADCIKKDVKDVMDADELRNKIKYVSTACFARIRPSLRHSV
jgi:hypothetical protein